MNFVRSAHLSATGHLGPFGGTGAGAKLKSVVVGTGAASGVVTVYDGQDNTGTVVAVIDATAFRYANFHGTWCKNGLYVVLSGGNADVTVNYE